MQPIALRLDLCAWYGVPWGTFQRAEVVGFGAKLRRCFSPQPQALLPQYPEASCCAHVLGTSLGCPVVHGVVHDASRYERLFWRGTCTCRTFFSLCGRSGPLFLSDPLQCSHRGHRSRGISRIAQGSQVLLLACTTAQHMSYTGNLCHALIAARIHVM